MIETKYKPGTFVKLIVPKDMAKEAFALGKIESISSILDINGYRYWYNVRWFDANGRPESNTIGLFEQDLVEYEN